MKILIPNATTSKNLGDQAMLEVLLKYVEKSYPLSEVIIHSDDPTNASETNYIVRQSFSQYVGNPSLPRSVRLYRIFYVYFIIGVYYIFGINCIKQKSEIGILLQDYVQADYIFFCAGGALRSRRGMLDFIYLFMKLLPYVVTKLTTSTIIVFPISFGPFGHKISEKLSALSLNHCSKIFLREKISFQKLKQHRIRNIYQSSDLSFMQRCLSISHRKTGVGFTLRDWFLDKEKQVNMENQFIQSIIQFHNKYPHVDFYPFVQVQDKELGETDEEVLQRVCQKIKKVGISVKNLTIFSSVNDACTFYRSRELVISMRLHANILAATQYTPFVALSYEYKTIGITKSIHCEKYVLAAASLVSDTLAQLFQSVYENRIQIAVQLRKSVSGIQDQLQKQLNSICIRSYSSLATKISIVIPCFNEAKNIVLLLKDIHAQTLFTHNNVSIHIFNDASTDETSFVVNILNDPSVIVHEYKQRRGKIYRLNEFFKTVKNDEIVIQLDADIRLLDIFTLEKLIKPIQKDHFHFSCGWHAPMKSSSLMNRIGQISHAVWFGAMKSLPYRFGVYQCNGNIRAFSGYFLNKFRFPKGCGSCEDMYSYIYARENGYQLSLVSDAIAYYNSPETITDYIKQMARFQQTDSILERYFEQSTMRKYLTIKLYNVGASIVSNLLSDPIATVLYVWLQIASKCTSLFMKSSDVWDVSISTKALVLASKSR